jgi:chemotaxis signal transduction protein
VIAAADDRGFAGGDGIICCTVGSRQFAFRGADIRHVARAETLRPDTADDGRLGSLKISGQTIPVFGLGRTLGEPVPAAAAARHGDQHIAVTGRPGELVGWLVDRIARASAAEGPTVVPLPHVLGAPAAAWFDALVRLGDTSMLLLAPDHLDPRVTPAPAGSAPACQPAPIAPAARNDRTEPMALLFSTPALPPCHAPRYAISAKQIVAIVQALPLIPVPGSVDYVTGVSWWRNTVVPVIDFRSREDRHAVPQGRYLLAQCGGRLRGTIVAVPIDPEIALHKPAASDLGVSAASLPPFVDGVFGVGGDTAALLNLDALLSVKGT